MEYETSNICSNGIIYIPNGDGTYREIGITDVWGNFEDIHAGESYSSEEYFKLHPNDEYSFTATITDSTVFEEWLAKWQELWNRQCVWDILLAAELYDIDGISQDESKTIHKLKEIPEKDSEESTTAEAKDTTEYFDSQEGAFFTGGAEDVNERMALDEMSHCKYSCYACPPALFGSYTDRYSTGLSFDAKKVLMAMFQEACEAVLLASQLYDIDGECV